VLTLALLALALSLQPWSVLASILLVTSRGGVPKVVAYVAGWMLALLAVAVATVLLYPQLPQSSSTSQVLAAIEVAAGLALAGWLLVRWRRPAQDHGSGQPRWMARLDGIRATPAFVLGTFLPNYVVVVAAVSEMLQSGLAQGWLAVAGLGFVLLSTAGVAAPLVVLLVRGDQAPDTYRLWRIWIVAHNRAVVYAVGALACLVLLVKGVTALL
jgi:hypothetical protein